MLKLRSKKALLLALVLVVYLFSPFLIEARARRSVSGFDFSKATFQVLTTQGQVNVLSFRSGKPVQINGVKVYSESLSHHNPFLFWAGFSYIKVEDVSLSASSGPCGNFVLLIPETIQKDEIDKERLISLLLANGYQRL